MVDQVKGIKVVFDAETTSLDKAIKTARSFELQVDRITKAFRKGAIDEAAYRRSKRDLAYAYRKAAGDSKVASQALRDYANSAMSATEANQDLVRAQNAVGKSQNRLGMVTQQAGYQVGDFIVQVQSGTNAFVAFGQQATQLVGLLGLVNPALIGLGAALGVAIPLVTAFGAAWSRTREKTEAAKESTIDFTEVLREAREELRLSNLNMGAEQAQGLSDLVKASRSIIRLSES